MDDVLPAPQALADPTRFEIFRLIRQRVDPDGEPSWVAMSEVRSRGLCVPSTLPTTWECCGPPY